MIIRMIFSLLLLVASNQLYSQQVKDKKVFKDIEKQTQVMLDSIHGAAINNKEWVAPRTIENGKLKMVNSRDWTCGFFAGQLWFLYEYTGVEIWKQRADSFTRVLEKEKMNAGTHDMGFKMYCSFGNGWKLTNDSYYKDVIIQSATTLTKRFNKTIGSIRSWDHNRDKWEFPVIIDNMMNLELLFAATRFTGDSSYYNIAVTHANTTLKNHYRKDFSSYHVVDYDTITGQVKNKVTHQGYANESAWARGQAWGLYGFTMCYRETKNPLYLAQADSIAAFIFNHPQLPKDLVPYWDFNDPAIPNVSRDASAAAIMASALFELSAYSKQAKKYKMLAEQIVKNLTKYYRSPVGQNKGFILLHSTGHKPHNSEIDVPINYADYYYIEALLRSKQVNSKL